MPRSSRCLAVRLMACGACQLRCKGKVASSWESAGELPHVQTEESKSEQPGAQQSIAGHATAPTQLWLAATRAGSWNPGYLHLSILLAL